MNTVLITGASSGIGKKFAEVYAKEGNNLVLVSRNLSSLCQLKDYFELTYKISVYVIIQDLSSENAANTIFNELSKNGIHIDVLVNNAGFGKKGLFDQLSSKIIYQMLMVNIVNLVELTNLLLPSMVEEKKGTIINIGSISSFVPAPYNSLYSASKAFVLSFSKSLHVEYKNKGVLILVICPGPTDTNFFKIAGETNTSIGKKRTTAQVIQTTKTAIRKRKFYSIDGLKNKILISFTRFIPYKFIGRLIYHQDKNIYERSENIE